MHIQPNRFLYTAILAALSAIPPLSIDMNLPAIPDIEAAFQAAPGQGALTLSLFLLGFSVAPLLGGPLTDRFGRRGPVLAALAANAAAAFACTLNASFAFLLTARLFQGLASGVCVLMPLAMVRDNYAGAEARRKMSTIMFVGGVAPLVAPILGGWVLLLAGWRAIYAVQGGLCVVLFALIATGVAETLPPDRRASIRPRILAHNYGRLFSDRRFLCFALPQAFGFGCMFSYISGSPGLLLGAMGLSEQGYSLIFAGTSCGMLLGSVLSGILVRWEVAARSIIAGALSVLALAVCAVLLLTWGHVLVLHTLVPLFLAVMCCAGVMFPNAMSEAVAPWPEMAGSASGAVNSLQMFVGAGASALVPFLAARLDAGRGMGVSMFLGMLLAVGSYALLRPKSEARRAARS